MKQLRTNTDVGKLPTFAGKYTVSRAPNPRVWSSVPPCTRKKQTAFKSLNLTFKVRLGLTRRLPICFHAPVRAKGVSPVFLQIIHILTMLAFTAHAVVGCCLHHAHPEKSRSAASYHSEASEKHSCKSACHHRARHEHDTRPVDPESDPCEEGSCIFFTDSVASKFEVKLTVGPSMAIPVFVIETPALVSKTRSLHTAPRDPRPPAATRLRAILHSWIV